MTNEEVKKPLMYCISLLIMQDYQLLKQKSVLMLILTNTKLTISE